jgi:class 3 adenylate cyclase
LGEQRKVAAILIADVVGFSRLTGMDEEATLARMRALRSELFNPAVESHSGRVVKRMGDGVVLEFKSVVEAVRCAIDVIRGLAERNAGLPPELRIEVRTGIHLGDVVEEADGDLLGDGVNIAARLEGICAPGGICLSEDAWRQVRDKLPQTFVDLGEQQLKNIARPMRAYALGTAGGGPVASPVQLESSARPLRDGKPIPAAVASAFLAILENAARLIGAAADVMAARRRAVSSADPRAEDANPAARTPPEVQRLEARARDRMLRRAIIFAAIIALAFIRECRAPQTYAPPSPPPHPAAHFGP